MIKFVLDQNNAGGFYLEGMPELSIIIAADRAAATAIAESRGIDFTDGCDGCCGNRWWIQTYDPGFHGEGLPELIDLLPELSK